MSDKPKNSPFIKIHERTIGKGYPTYVVAEMSANHHQSLEQAISIIDAVHASGADAIKIQTAKPNLITLDSDQEYFKVKGTIWNGRSLYDLYQEVHTPWEWHEKLKETAVSLGLDFFSSPFDPSAVDFLEKIGVPVYKIASSEIVDLPLLRKVAETGKPVIVSTGMATLSEIEEAVLTLRSAGCSEILMLKCTAAYPALPAEANLSVIPHLSEIFGIPVGLSDHTLGVAVPVVAVTLGACVVEKHFTLDRRAGGPDSAFSLEPSEFKAMVEAIRAAEQSIGNVIYGPTPSELKTIPYRRSLFVVQDVKAGEPFTEENVRSIRPANGLHTRHLSEVLGKHASRDIERGTPLAWDLVQAAADGGSVTGSD